MIEQNFNLQLHKGNDGYYRWHFSIEDNIKCVGTDPQETMREAFDDAKLILETNWDEGKDFNIQLYNAKDGHRWRFLIDGNNKCRGTDPQDTLELSFADAKLILCNVWKVGEFPENKS